MKLIAPLAILTFCWDAGINPAYCQENPKVFAPLSEAVLCGEGDVYQRKPISSLKLEGTDFESIGDLAGSWVFIYETGFYDQSYSGFSNEMDRVKQANILQRQLSALGLICIAVARPSSTKSGMPDPSNPILQELDHPLWISRTPRVGLDDVWPGAILVDPIGMIAMGGRQLHILETASSTVNHLRAETPYLVNGDGLSKMIQAHPGLALEDSPSGSKLRQAIAKRKWSAAFKSARGNELLQERMEGIIQAQIEWAEVHMKNGDALSANARVNMLKGLPKKNPLTERAAGLASTWKKDQSVKQLKKDLEAVLKLARKMDEELANSGIRRYYDLPTYKKFQKEIDRFEAKGYTGVSKVVLNSSKFRLGTNSPLRPCKGCGNPRHKCGC